MLLSVFKCKEEMGYTGECSKPKKTKTTDCNYSANWEYLPTLVLEEIFCYLNEKDRINASCTCHSWRQLYFRPKFHKEVRFNIQMYNLEEAQFKIRKFGHMVSNAFVQFDSLSPKCVAEFLDLISRLAVNKNLVSISIEPSHSHIQYQNVSGSKQHCLANEFINMCVGRHIECLNLGLNEELTYQISEFLYILQQSKPEKVKQLGLASIKDDPGNYVISNCNPTLFKPFVNLQVLSIDYDILNDSLLNSLRAASDLERLVVHIHGIWDGHPGTSEEAWKDFTEQHPRCLLRVSFIHAYDEVMTMQDILKKNMPLSHLKVLFCENINIPMLEMLPRYHETFQSLMWVDAQCHDEVGNSWNIIKQITETMRDVYPDPLVMLSWRCRLLEELVLIGYKYAENDLVAIARLRSNSLKRLEVPLEDILYLEENEDACKNSFKEIGKLLGKSWSPIHFSNLHPVILDPTDGDSDEYLMPILLADLH